MFKQKLQTLKGLNDRLQKVRLEVAPRRKFAFNPMPKAASAAPALNASEPAQKDDAATATGSTNGPKSSAFTPLENTLNLIHGPGYIDVGVVLADSKYSVVKCPVPTPALTIKNMQKAVIMAGPVDGAAHVGIRAPEDTQKNLWDQVKDFNWLKAGHSPNWSLLGLEHQLGADQWKALHELEEGNPVGTILTSFRIS
ncbi:MAG: hypothetical protein Q9182_002527 [Xanthomendoza sp. 2 TL-2023]